MGFNQNILYNSLAIIPSVNLVKNIGYSENSENSDKILLLPRSMRRVANLKSYELDFPLKNPNFMMPDILYTEILQNKHKQNPLVRIIVKFDRGLRILIFAGPRRFYTKFIKFLKRYFNYELRKKRYK